VVARKTGTVLDGGKFHIKSWRNFRRLSALPVPEKRPPAGTCASGLDFWRLPFGEAETANALGNPLRGISGCGKKSKCGFIFKNFPIAADLLQHWENCDGATRT